MIYDKLASGYDRKIAPLERRFLSRWREEALAFLPENAAILEIGAGTGLNFKFYPRCRRAVASEISGPMLLYAKEKTTVIDLVQADAQILPFGANTFDAAFATLVFCSIPDPKKAFAELRKVVRPGGRVILLEHVRPAGALGYVFDFINIFTSALMDDRFNRRTANLAEDAGLKVVEIRKKAFGIVNLSCLRDKRMKSISNKKIRVGCQAWGYDDWVGRPGQPVFYPQGTQDADKLSLYAEIFDLIELDSAVYGIPSSANIEAWCRKTPEGFIFAPKLPNTITHRNSLGASTWPMLAEFCERVREFGEKLGPILVLLPSLFEPARENAVVLRQFLERLPRDLRFAVEFRHPGWLTAWTFDLLKEHGVALAMAEGRWISREEFFKRIEVPAADFAYIRFSGPRDLTKVDRIYRNMDANLSEWADRIKKIPAREIFIFVSNFYEGHSPESVNKLKRLLSLETRDPASLEKQLSLF